MKIATLCFPIERMWKGDSIWLPLLCEGKKIRAKVIYTEDMEDVETFEWEPLAA